MKERLLGQINRENVSNSMKRVEPAFSVSESIADELSLTVYDQDLSPIAKRLAMWQSGLTPNDKPIMVALLLGPPGVGKTETAHAVTKYFTNNRESERLIKLDGSDYQDAHSWNAIKGAPQGYVGYNEESAIPHRIVNQRNAVTIILLDEVEKMHRNTLMQFLQAFDKGRINARNGNEGFEDLDLTRTVFLMTSNIASETVVALEKGEKKKIGFNRENAHDTDAEIQRAIKDALKVKFPPEFLDRVDVIQRYMPLEKEETRRSILMKFLNQQNEAFKDRWAQDAPYLMLTKEAQDFLLSKKEDKGGRGIRRMFDDHVLSKLPDVMMGLDFKRRPFVADITDEGITEWYTDNPEPLIQQVPQLPEWSSSSQPEAKKKEEGREDDDHDLGDFGDIPPMEDEEDSDFYTVRFRPPIADKNGDWPVVDLSIVVKQKGRGDMIQLVENLPLIQIPKQ